ncbi:MAG: M20 family metallopeptidase [Hyphomicrobiales bacterium]|nr:M20 family metallopeptidase [Hyphomicrobiales bacterium]MBV8763533.1 M20 family metallopeptidase [Hyphomicrobiales bacterium]MBV9430938.1 M20 family metallopeptidase [Hyphomicrobiales bacterium]MBV9739249.1 M20 family metallopeptidase [Hyphomicrobiales bacterium]
MIELLAELVNTDSGSYDKQGVDAAGEVLKRYFVTQGLALETIPQPQYGDQIRATLDHPTSNDRRPIILMGHRDTVFPKGEPKRRPFRIENGRGYGPGVCDMKAGLVMNAFVLAALKRFGGHPGPVVALVTSDEEIASPSSRPVIEAEARAARAVFNAEPSRVGRKITSGRKGGVFSRCEVTGKAAHSGANFKDGVSAIEELARKIPRFHKLTDLAPGTTVNVGLIGGGQTVNTVAPSAWCEIDLRYVKTKDRDQAVAAIQEIAETCSVAGAKSSFTIKGEFLPLEQTPEAKALFDLYQAAASVAGFSVSAEFTGGCADSGYTAAQGCPTLCSVGPVGGKAHTPDEFLEIDTMVPCAQALALSVMRLKEGVLPPG